MPLDSSLNFWLEMELTIGLILNQNDSTKEAITSRNSTSPSNPLENLLGVCLITINSLLLQTKVTDFKTRNQSLFF
jgi:hypothetical protein